MAEEEVSGVVDLQLDELEEFIENIDPEGILLCITADPDIQPDIMKRVENAGELRL